MKSIARVFGAAAIIFVSVSAVTAHEYWLEPLDYTPSASEIVAANVRVGQDFKGDAIPFIPQMVVQYRVYDSQGMREPGGDVGDRPALQVEARQSGLMIMAYQSSVSRTTFNDLEKFQSYLEFEGIPEFFEQHRARGLPDEGFAELYSRFPKTLIDVDGTGVGTDQVVGLRAELVALDNPYALSAGDGVRVQLFWEGEVQADRQIKVFAKPINERAGELEVVDLRTNAQGVVKIPLQANTRYLLSSVKLIGVEPVQADDAVWESFWASMTFEFS